MQSFGDLTASFEKSLRIGKNVAHALVDFMLLDRAVVLKALSDKVKAAERAQKDTA